MVFEVKLLGDKLERIWFGKYDVSNNRSSCAGLTGEDNQIRSWKQRTTNNAYILEIQKTAYKKHVAIN